MHVLCVVNSKFANSVGTAISLLLLLLVLVLKVARMCVSARVWRGREHFIQHANKHGRYLRCNIRHYNSLKRTATVAFPPPCNGAFDLPPPGQLAHAVREER